MIFNLVTSTRDISTLEQALKCILPCLHEHMAWSAFSYRKLHCGCCDCFLLSEVAINMSFDLLRVLFFKLRYSVPFFIFIHLSCRSSLCISYNCYVQLKLVWKFKRMTKFTAWEIQQFMDTSSPGHHSHWQNQLLVDMWGITNNWFDKHRGGLAAVVSIILHPVIPYAITTI